MAMPENHEEIYKELYNLIKLDNEEVKTALVTRFSADELRTALTKLSDPIKLSFTQRMIARAFNIDVVAQQSRFVKLVKEVLDDITEAEQDSALTQHQEEAFCQQNLK